MWVQAWVFAIYSAGFIIWGGVREEMIYYSNLVREENLKSLKTLVDKDETNRSGNFY